MTQQEVYVALKKEKGWITSKELAKKMNLSSSSVTSALSKMYKWKEVKRKEVGKQKNCWSMFPSGGYKWKLR